MRFAEIRLLDHHCHALRRPGPPLDAPSFRGHFSETRDPGMTEHLRHGLFYRRGLRDLAAVLGCETEEEAVLEARAREVPERHARRLVEAAGISGMLVDTGYRGGENFTLDEQRRFLPCSVQEVLRLESLIEQLLVETSSFEALEEAFRAAIAGARGNGVVALKSVAAYRGGLEVMPRPRDEALRAYPALREQADRDGSVRLTDRTLLEYFLRVALELAGRDELPVQFHTGFGDEDADLRSANPLHLRPLLQDPALRRTPIVLLHCWPFVREAGYLAGIYRNVYADLSLTVPFTAHGGVEAVLAVLEQAPVSKVLLSTDAFSIPELFYLGSLYGREALHEALHRLERAGWLNSREIPDAARRILHDNSAGLYQVS